MIYNIIFIVVGTMFIAFFPYLLIEVLFGIDSYLLALVIQVLINHFVVKWSIKRDNKLLTKHNEDMMKEQEEFFEKIKEYPEEKQKEMIRYWAMGSIKRSDEFMKKHGL